MFDVGKIVVWFALKTKTRLPVIVHVYVCALCMHKALAKQGVVGRWNPTHKHPLFALVRNSITFEWHQCSSVAITGI